VHRTAHPVAPSAAAPQRRSRAFTLAGAVLLGAAAALALLVLGSGSGPQPTAEKWPCASRF